ncbi:MaoC family dehydratase [Bosea sp. (in: a-proteobacteria)]|uniref:MaoC family dehydratase n=1 Tax=Bosea sp. (in: a-proteobacteria) TaxID=1871050 RepID=UPI002FC665C2
MRDAVKTLGQQRYRETFGRHYEEFVIGDVYEHRPGRTISETDNTWFSLLTMNTHPLHFDAEYAARSEFGRLVVSSPLTVSIIVGMSVSDVSQKAKANLGWKEIRLTAPVFCGDTLYAETEVLEKRESASRPGDGIVTVKTTGRNQDGTAVCDFVRSMLVPKRGHGVDDAANY